MGLLPPPVNRLASSWHVRASHAWSFWVYLLVLATIEALTAMSDLRIGLALHIGLLFGLVLHSSLGSSEEQRRLALVLTLVPLIRMLGLALPLLQVPPSIWYLLVTLMLAVAVGIIARQTGLSRRALGLSFRQHALHAMMMSGGLGLGVAQFALAQPHLLHSSTMDGLPLPLLVLLLVGSSFIEELIFRGLVQAAALPVMGRWGLVYGALLFAVLHIGYRSVGVVLFALLMGLLFAQLVSLSGSILGVALLHTVIDTMRLLVLPLVLPGGVLFGGVLVQALLAGSLTSLLLVVILLCMTTTVIWMLLLLGYLCNDTRHMLRFDV